MTLTPPRDFSRSQGDLAAVPSLASLHHGPLVTPTTRLDRLFPHSSAQVWVKLDHLQISGSVKERSAAGLIEGLGRRGELHRGTTLVASTSGNLGVAVARQAAVRGLDFVAVVDSLTNRATVQAMKAFGATVEMVDNPADGNRLAARMARVQALLDELPDAVEIDQYGSDDNPSIHQRTTLPELVAQIGAVPTDLYVAVSTVGTLLGCQRALAEHGWATRVVAVDAAGSALFGGVVGPRLLPGLGAGVVSTHASRAFPDAVRRVSDADMIRGARRLARTEGLLCGASTGAVVAALESDLASDAAMLGPDRVIAMIAHDSGVPYLDTVYDDDWVAREVPDALAPAAQGRSW